MGPLIKVYQWILIEKGEDGMSVKVFLISVLAIGFNFFHTLFVMGWLMPEVGLIHFFTFICVAAMLFHKRNDRTYLLINFVIATFAGIGGTMVLLALFNSFYYS